MFRMLGGALGAMILAVALGFNVSAWAQQEQEFSEAKLDSFIDAAIKVEQLIDEWSPKIEGAADEQAANDMREQANAELAEAIDQTDGITVAEYQEISQAARSDPALSERLQSLYDTKTGG